jgi:ABC-type uncharacterized transport system auxiliary subunit
MTLQLFFNESGIISMIRKFFPGLLLVLLVSGCSPRGTMPARYYVLDYPSGYQVSIEGDTPIPRACLVRNVNIYPAYSTNQIALRENTYEIRYFTFNQWAVRPEQSFTQILIRFMNDNNIFETFQTSTLFAEYDCSFETTIYHLQLIEEDNNYLAHLNIEFRLREGTDGRTITDHRADRKNILKEKNLNLFAESISILFIEELEKFTNSLLADSR